MGGSLNHVRYIVCTEHVPVTSTSVSPTVQFSHLRIYTQLRGILLLLKSTETRVNNRLS
jgi:hypothetical protein